MLFHFSDNPAVTRFIPRPLRTPVARPQGQAWLNGPLVWAIRPSHAFLYHFPRDCPRIVIWATDKSTDADKQHWLGHDQRVAYVEESWMDRIASASIYRYQLPDAGFRDLEDVGMSVASHTVIPKKIDHLTDLPARLTALGVALRAVPSLQPIKMVWDSSLHASGIRLRHAT